MGSGPWDGLLLLAFDRARLEALLQSPSLSPPALAAALVVAFFLGAVHALTPGHGKAIVAAYLVGSRGRVLDAVWLGGIVTATHTASVFALGIAALYASQRFAMDRIQSWLGLVSGLLVAAIGASLLWQRMRHAHAHPHEHGHHHDHPHTHPHDHGHEHSGNLLSLGISGGLVPCPEALVVLMISISLGRLWLGLAVLVAFSLGLATVLIAVGTAMVLAGPAVRNLAGESRWMRLLPVASAAVVTVLGIVIALQAAKSF
jgi:ABC-type nickel/cobalt efflux system permease component RcnA